MPIFDFSFIHQSAQIFCDKVLDSVSSSSDVTRCAVTMYQNAGKKINVILNKWNITLINDAFTDKPFLRKIYLFCKGHPRYSDMERTQNAINLQQIQGISSGQIAGLKMTNITVHSTSFFNKKKRTFSTESYKADRIFYIYNPVSANLAHNTHTSDLTQIANIPTIIKHLIN